MSLTLRDGNYKVTDGFLSLIRVEGGKGHYKDPRLGEMRQIDIEYGEVVRCNHNAYAVILSKTLY